MTRLLLFLFSFGALASSRAGAVPAGKRQLPPVALKPVALSHATKKIDFNAMIDANEDRGERLKSRLHTKMRGKSLHLTRGHVRIVKSESGSRREASVKPLAKRRSHVKGSGKDVQVTLLPAARPPASTKLTKAGN